MKKLKKILKAIWAHLMGERFVKEFKMINGSVWWGEQGKTVRSFDPIFKSTAIGYVTEYSAKVYFPTEIYDIDEGVYEAKVERYLILPKEELEKWLDKINEHPFI